MTLSHPTPLADTTPRMIEPEANPLDVCSRVEPVSDLLADVESCGSNEALRGTVML